MDKLAHFSLHLSARSCLWLTMASGHQTVQQRKIWLTNLWLASGRHALRFFLRSRLGFIFGFEWKELQKAEKTAQQSCTLKFRSPCQAFHQMLDNKKYALICVFTLKKIRSLVRQWQNLLLRHATPLSCSSTEMILIFAICSQTHSAKISKAAHTAFVYLANEAYSKAVNH